MPKEIFKKEDLAAELEFAVNLLRMTSSNKTEVFSPANLSLCLTLLQQATKGPIRQKIANVLRNETSETLFLSKQKLLRQTLQKADKGVLLDIATGFFVRDGLVVKDAYLKGLKENFNADVTKLNFCEKQKSKKIIEDFVNKATRGKIHFELAPKYLEHSVAIIISVLYANATWNDPFDERSTRLGDFTESDGKVNKMMFMHDYDDNNYPYYEDGDVQVLSKPYKDPSYNFVWILPKHPKEFDRFRQKLTGEKIQKYLNSLEEKEIDVRVPKMKISREYRMPQLLDHLGLSELLNDADFSGITDMEFFLTNGAHKTLIEVDEVGTVAVAVDILYADFIGTPPPKFHATHPFIFLMHKNQHPIMIGQFNGECE